MLKAKLPTQQELTSLYKEVEVLRRDKKLKDDTIKFLQKEKESIQRQLQNYEQLCEDRSAELPHKHTSNEDQLLEIRQLQADMEHLKDVIRRQNLLLRNAGTSGNSSLDKSLVRRVCSNLTDLLHDVKTPMSGQVRSELEHQRDGMDRLNPNKKAEIAWHFLEIVDRALMELKAVHKRSDLPDLRSSISKYSSTPISSGSSGSGGGGSNLLTTNSTSLANLSSDSGYSQRKRSGGRLARISGSRLERSVSAPALNGLVPHPPKAPPPLQRL